MDGAALNGHTVKRLYMEFLIKIWEIYGKYGTFNAAVQRKTLKNDKPVANQMPGFVGAGTSFRVELLRVTKDSIPRYPD
jgi:hypothetical protein